MARGAFDQRIGAWYEPTSQTVWSPELKGWVNRAGDLFRQGQGQPWDGLPDDQKEIAVNYAAKIPQVAGAKKAAAPQPQQQTTATPPPQQSQPAPRPSAIPSIATSPTPPQQTDLMALAKSIGAMR